MAETVIVTLELALKPEAVEDFCTQIPTMLDETRKFPGFVNITIRRHMDDPNRVVFVEEWAARSDYEAYVEFRTSTGVMDSMMDVLTEEPRTNIWQQRVA